MLLCLLQKVANGFVVAHYTGEQTYSVSEEWLQGAPSSDLVALLESSTNQLLRDIAKVHVMTHT